MAEQGQRLIRCEPGLGQQRPGEAAAVLKAAGFAGGKRLLEVPYPATAAEPLRLKGQATLEEPFLHAGLEQEVGDVAPGGRIGGVAAAEQQPGRSRLYQGLRHALSS